MHGPCAALLPAAGWWERLDGGCPELFELEADYSMYISFAVYILLFTDDDSFSSFVLCYSIKISHNPAKSSEN